MSTDQQACSICFTTDGVIAPGCQRCEIALCFNCSRNNCKGLCPICDRQILNRPCHCAECHKDFHVKDGLMCNGCSADICYTCFGDYKHESCGECRVCYKDFLLDHGYTCWDCSKMVCVTCHYHNITDCSDCGRILCIQCSENETHNCET